MKTIMVILLVALGVTVNAQVKPIIEVESGYKNFNVSVKHINFGFTEVSLKHFPMYFNFITGASYKGFKVLSSIENYVGLESGQKSFTPKQVDYTLSLSYQYKILSLEYSHMCSHPIISEWMVTNTVYTMAYDKIVLRVKIL